MPVPAALYVGVIAGHTGWADDYIRWQLPLARGWAIFHAARLLSGEPRVWHKPTQSDIEAEAKTHAFIEKFRPAKSPQ